MKKLIFTIFGFLVKSVAAFSADDLDMDTLGNTVLVEKKGVYQPRCSQEIDETDQYFGLPKVPLVHHYTNFNSPRVLLAIKGRLPADFFLKNENIRERMDAVGVTITDPFLVVVQSFSFVDNVSSKLLLRPMYYFCQNKDSQAEGAYDEVIDLNAAILGITSELSITPDKPETPYKYRVSVHNKPSHPQIISSGNNMAVSELQYNQSHAFYGFYKGTSRIIKDGVNRLVLPENRGVTVLHVVLGEDHVGTFNDYLDLTVTYPTVRSIVEALRSIEQSNQSGKEFATLLYQTIESMVKEEFDRNYIVPIDQKV